MRGGLFRRFGRDRKGIAAVEFALIFPFLLVLLLGTFEVTRAAITHKKTQKVAYTIDQILNQSTTVTAEQVQKILSASSTLMGTADASRLTIEVAYHYVDDTGKITTQWLQRLAKAGTQNLGSQTLPADYAKSHHMGFLTTRVSYDFQSVVSSQFFKSIGMTAESIVRPRAQGEIKCSNC